jgi:hypothetical protein
MTCLCKNPDGSFSHYCLGTCTQKAYVPVDAVQVRSDKSIEDRLEYLLGIFLDKLDVRIKNIERIADQKYKEGLRDGLEMYREIY